MEKAKAAINKFTGQSGHHDTTVHETVAPSVEHKTVKPHEHEEINTAVDREVHQDHYHRSVQPVQDREVLPETHTAKLGSVQHQEYDHRDHDSTKRTLEADQAQFRNQQTVEPTTTSRSVAPVVGGEHQHHHIYETIQPVVQKESIQPNVVHTTVPIHEVHHNKAQHHDTTALPAMTMDEFKNRGGSLGGREERFDRFEGTPKNIGGSQGQSLGSGRGLAEHEREQARHGGSTMAGTTGGMSSVQQDRNMSGTAGAMAGTTGGMAAAEQHHHADRGMAGQGNLTGSSTQGGVASSTMPNEKNLMSNRQDDGIASTDHGRHEDIDASDIAHSKMKKSSDEPLEGHLPKALTEDKSKAVPHSEFPGQKHQGHQRGDSVHDENAKPSMKDKLNPKVDADGDGKAGIMD